MIEPSVYGNIDLLLLVYVVVESAILYFSR